MKTLNVLLVASTLALGASPKPKPVCDTSCEDIVLRVAAQAQICLRIDEQCAATVRDYVVHCMVRQGPSGLALPGDDCINMAIEKMLQCAK